MRRGGSSKFYQDGVSDSSVQKKKDGSPRKYDDYLELPDNDGIGQVLGPLQSSMAKHRRSVVGCHGSAVLVSWAGQ